MTKEETRIEQLDIGSLVSEIARDAQTLVTKQVKLLRTDVMQQVKQAGVGFASIAAGGSLIAAGGLLSGMMVAHMLQRSTKLPLWACYGIVGGGLGAAGIELLRQGTQKVTSVQLVPPPETTEALEENLEWAKHQLTT